MTLMAERRGAQTELVASAHSLRVLLVTLIIPFGFQFAGLHGLDTTVLGARVVSWPGLAGLTVLTGAGCWVMVKRPCALKNETKRSAGNLSMASSGQLQIAPPIGRR